MGMTTMLNDVRRRIEREVLSHTGLAIGGVDYERPAGDPGLFGPTSVCWRIHGDFTSMLVGGLSALLLQMLHPLALAGVWDHSAFRQDMLGRLRRTGQFIAGTTFAGRDEAARLIRRVRAIHGRVSGVAPDGRTYAASDPQLLTWVHVAEVRSFLAAHLRYLNGDLSRELQDRYYQETARVAIALGAEEVPASSREVEAYLESMRVELRCDARTLEVLRILGNAPTTNAAVRLFSVQAMHAALDLLPDFARDFYPQAGMARRLMGRAFITGSAPLIRWAVRDNSYYRAHKRLGLAPPR